MAGDNSNVTPSAASAPAVTAADVSKSDAQNAGQHLPTPGKEADGLQAKNPHGSGTQPEVDQFFGGKDETMDERHKAERAEQDDRDNKQAQAFKEDFLEALSDPVKMPDAMLAVIDQLLPYVNAEKEKRKLARNSEVSLHGTIDNLGRRTA